MAVKPRAIFWAIFVMALYLFLWAMQSKYRAVEAKQARQQAELAEPAKVFLQTMRRNGL